MLFGRPPAEDSRKKDLKSLVNELISTRNEMTSYLQVPKPEGRECVWRLPPGMVKGIAGHLLRSRTQPPPLGLFPATAIWTVLGARRTDCGVVSKMTA
ncbi:hypothetical protein [Terracidiphilus sp.]|uniref:hypothetical protein n=1 Tax=Terracidiphilus sp. TaxID=1964191 RepID=UPI003C172F3A